MNPDTNKFEKLFTPKDIITKFKDEQLLKHIKTLEEHLSPLILVRADGTPVPQHWSIFTIGELVIIKNYTFKVVHIGESYILFEPVKSIQLLQSTESMDKK